MANKSANQVKCIKDERDLNRLELKAVRVDASAHSITAPGRLYNKV
jgi:hypothetical protein